MSLSPEQEEAVKEELPRLRHWQGQTKTQGPSTLPWGLFSSTSSSSCIHLVSLLCKCSDMSRSHFIFKISSTTGEVVVLWLPDHTALMRTRQGHSLNLPYLLVRIRWHDEPRQQDKTGSLSVLMNSLVSLAICDLVCGNVCDLACGNAAPTFYLWDQKNWGPYLQNQADTLITLLLDLCTGYCPDRNRQQEITCQFQIWQHFIKSH